MARSFLALVLVASLAAAAAAPKDTPAAGKDVPDAKGAPAAKDQKWFSSSNPFAPLANPEPPKEKPAPASDEGTPRPESPRVAAPYAASPAAPAAPSAAPAMPKLNGILSSVRMTVAIVDDTLVKVGDEVGGMRIKSISVDTVLAEKEGARYVMTTRRPAAQALPEGAPEKAASAGAANCGPEGETVSSASPETADKKAKEIPEKVAAGAATSGVEQLSAGEDK